VALKAMSLKGIKDWKQLELFQREAVVLKVCCFWLVCCVLCACAVCRCRGAASTFSQRACACLLIERQQHNNNNNNNRA
jgi:hypothetical protein